MDDNKNLFESVWLRAYCAIMANPSVCSDHWNRFADKALSDFKERFGYKS